MEFKEEVPIDFRALPKIELHAHLSGSISRQCLHEVWAQKKARGETDLADPLVEMPEGKFDYDLETYIYALCSDRAAIVYTTKSVLEAFHADGVVYLELRTTPRTLPPSSSSPGLSADDYVQTVLSCISSFNAANPRMKTNLILSIDRRHSLDTALSIVSLAAKYATQGVVGVDLCGDPSVSNVALLAPAFEASRAHGLKRTIHFAEAPASSSDEELRALLSYMPDRIGHVIHVPADVKDEIVRRRLGLELCLSCNVHAKMIAGGFGDHHFGWWRGSGCPIALSTDDVGIFGSSLSNEYALAAEHFKMSRAEVLELARGPVEIIFGSEEDKMTLRDKMWV